VSYWTLTKITTQTEPFTSGNTAIWPQCTDTHNTKHQRTYWIVSWAKFSSTTSNSCSAKLHRSVLSSVWDWIADSVLRRRGMKNGTMCIPAFRNCPRTAGNQVWCASCTTVGADTDGNFPWCWDWYSSTSNSTHSEWSLGWLHCTMYKMKHK